MAYRGFSHAGVGRTGLGNMLFPWARAEVFAALAGCRMLAVQWTQPKVGPLLRGETDLRYYTSLFRAGDRVRGPRRWLALSRTPRHDGDALLARLEAGEDPAGLPSGLAVFSGYDGWFREDLPRHRVLVRDRLFSMLAPRVRAEIDAFGPVPEIAVHIRRGDFYTLQPGEEFGDHPHAGESEAYFVAAVEGVRAALGREADVAVFSNARPEELKTVPRMPGVRLVPSGHTAATDMLLMSRARVLVASSNSSFSAWASYLGGMPTLWHRPLARPLVPGREELAIEVGPDARLDRAAEETLRSHADAVADVSDHASSAA